MLRKKVVLIAVLLLMFIAVAGCTDSSSSKSNNEPAKSTETSKSEKADLELLDSSIVKDEFGTRYVVGTVKNNTDKEYSYVQVEINLYDDSGAQVGSTLDNTNNLEPGGTWKFKAVIMEDNATKYRIKDISGF
ncbi:MAG TPA: DUF3426 domain-containing protein [Peptococcaceae bacterium]|nr:MAG: Uncharacterized protein XD50_1596 [Clostridia bacterium 41_269]HBT20620.1 DUF3426 domain-containing protein [Peptococcaceae bacterium]